MNYQGNLHTTHVSQCKDASEVYPSRKLNGVPILPRVPTVDESSSWALLGTVLSRLGDSVTCPVRALWDQLPLCNCSSMGKQTDPDTFFPPAVRRQDLATQFDVPYYSGNSSALFQREIPSNNKEVDTIVSDLAAHGVRDQITIANDLGKIIVDTSVSRKAEQLISERDQTISALQNVDLPPADVIIDIPEKSGLAQAVNIDQVSHFEF